MLKPVSEKRIFQTEKAVEYSTYYTADLRFVK